MFKIEAMRRKAQLVSVGQFRSSDVKMPEYDDGAVFAIFRKFDPDRNYFLEWQDFQECLESCPELKLTKEESLTITLLADMNSDGRLDYQEFMKHFKDIVYFLKYHNEL